MFVSRPGVGDLYTDPQLHSADESRGDGDLGRRGMALFFASLDSRKNGLFDALGIPHFDLSAAERHRAAESSKQAGSDSEETSPRTKQKIHRTHRSSVVRFAGLEAKTRMSCHDDARRCRREAAEAHRRGKRAAGARDDDHVDALDVNRRGLLAPKSPATATHEQRARREARAALDALDAVAADGGGREPRKIDVALGEVHGALARLHCEGRWTQALPDAASALLHAATGAARGDARCAYALARWHRRLPHPLLPAAPGCDVDLPAAPAPLDLDGPCLAPTAVWKSTSGMDASSKTSNLSSSIESKSIRLILGRIDRSRRVLEAPQKASRRNGRIRAH